MAITKEDILEAVGSMTVMDLNDLVKAFEMVHLERVLKAGCRQLFPPTIPGGLRLRKALAQRRNRQGRATRWAVLGSHPDHD